MLLLLVATVAGGGRDFVVEEGPPLALSSPSSSSMMVPMKADGAPPITFFDGVLGAERSRSEILLRRVLEATPVTAETPKLEHSSSALETLDTLLRRVLVAMPPVLSSLMPSMLVTEVKTSVEEEVVPVSIAGSHMLLLRRVSRLVACFAAASTESVDDVTEAVTALEREESPESEFSSTGLEIVVSSRDSVLPETSSSNLSFKVGDAPHESLDSIILIGVFSDEDFSRTGDSKSERHD